MLPFPEVLDNTMLSTFRSCNTKAKWEFFQNLAPEAISLDLHAGGVFAAARHEVYRCAYYGTDKSRDTQLRNAQVVFDTLWGDFVIPPHKAKSSKTKQRMWEAVVAYRDYYNPPNDYITPHPNFKSPFEVSFAIPMEKASYGVDFPLHPLTGQPFIYSGRFDEYGQNEFGRDIIIDDKTTTSVGADWHKQWILRSQFLGYVRSMQILGHQIDEVEIRGVGILKGEFKLGGEATARKNYTQYALDEWTKQAARDVREMVRVWEEDDWGKAMNDHCTHYGSCAFLDLCRFSNPEDLFSSYAKREWHPLGDQT